MPGPAIAENASRYTDLHGGHVESAYSLLIEPKLFVIPC